MHWLSRASSATGMLILTHAWYSAREHSIYATTLANGPGAAPHAKATTPTDIVIEAVIGTIVICLGLVLGSPPLRPIRWHAWAGKMEREGKAGFHSGTPQDLNDFGAHSFQLLECRPGFTDIRKQRLEFASWVRSSDQ